MEDNLSIQGALAETTVPDLFRSIVRSSETAVLTLDAIGRSDTIYFSEGRIVSAASTDPDVGVAETLLRAGELTIDEATPRSVSGSSKSAAAAKAAVTPGTTS